MSTGLRIRSLHAPLHKCIAVLFYCVSLSFPQYDCIQQSTGWTVFHEWDCWDPFPFVTLQYSTMPHLLHTIWSFHRGILFVGAPLILTATVFVHSFNKNKLVLSSQFGAKKCYTYLAEKEEIKPLSLYDIRSKRQGLKKYPALSDCTLVP